MRTAAAVLSILAAAACAQPGGPAFLVSKDRLMADLAALPTARAARGNPDSQRGLIATEDLLIARLKDAGYEPTLFPLRWTFAAEQAQRERAGRPPRPVAEEAKDRPWNNIVAELPGRDLPGEVLIVAAHFDAMPGTPGADDDGTGTAAVLELARVLRDQPMRRTVRLVFFNLEEVGLMGSIPYAAAVKQELDDGKIALVGMISLEMLGYFSDEPGSQKSPIPAIPGKFDPPTVGDFIALATTRSHADFAKRLEKEMLAAAGGAGLKVIAPDFVPDVPLCPPDFLRSDHAPFLFMGQPAVMVTDTSNFRNPHYHGAGDTIETIDADRFTLVVRGLAGAIHTLAEPAQTTTPGP